MEVKRWPTYHGKKETNGIQRHKKLLFIGYDKNTKGYRLIDPKTRKIIASRDVVFRKNNRNKITEKVKGAQERLQLIN